MRPEGERFLRPSHPYHRRYEALRAYFVESLSSSEVGRRFGYTPRSFEVLVARFRKNDLPPFWRDVRRGRQDLPVRTPLREAVLDLRRQGLSVYDIADRLRKGGLPTSHQTVWMILREAGAKRLPKRSAAQKARVPTLAPPVADAGELDLTPREVECRAPLLLYFASFLDRIGFDTSVLQSGYPASAMVPSPSALRSALALKLLQKPRKNHVMPLADDEGLGLFAGLNVLPKTTFLHDYSYRVGGDPRHRLLEGVVRARASVAAYPSGSFNLDFHTIRHYGDPEATRLEKNYVPRRARPGPEGVAGPLSVERLPGSGHGARDEELLRAAVPALRVGVVTDLHLSLGVALPEGTPSARRAREAGIPVRRRSTGGAAVLARPGDLLWTRVLPREDPRVGPDFVHAYGRLGGGAAACLRELGAAHAAWTEPPGISEELCLLSGRGRVLAAGRRSVGGAAQHRTAAALLHHGILQFEVDLPLLSDLFGIPPATLEEHLAGVADWAPGVSPEGLAAALGRHLGEADRAAATLRPTGGR